MQLKIGAACTILVTAISALGCTVSTDAPTENVGQTSDGLSVYQWFGDYAAGSSHSFYGASIATYSYNGLEATFMVHTGSGDSAFDYNNLYWARSLDGANWSDDSQIPNMYAPLPPKIAAFNGYLYMVHNGAYDIDSVWMSRFNTATSSWGQDFELPYRSASTPSIVAFNGSLYIIGNTFQTNQVWQATMSTAEVFSPAADLTGIISTIDTPSLAVHCPSIVIRAFFASVCTPTLYMAYRTNMGEVGMSGLQIPLVRRGAPKPTWWTPWVVVNTDGTHKKTWVAPALASYGGNLHLVDTDPATGDLIKWTYYDGSNWSTDVSIGSQRMWNGASLAPRSNVLSMVHSSSSEDHNSSNRNDQEYAEYFQ